MVFLDLIVKIVSENIQSLKVNPDSFNWIFCIECSSCKSIQPNDINFSLIDQFEMQKGHGYANFIMNCKECKKNMNISIHDKSNFYITCENGNDEGVLATFECRGCELKKWIPQDGIILEANESNTNFNDVDITDVWMGYDEISNINCSLLEPCEWRIEKNKKY
jgi:hypothetical protein